MTFKALEPGDFHAPTGQKVEMKAENGNMSVEGFKTAETVGQEIVDVILDGQKHQG
ncbi:hypothetical protein [Fructobacillus durionis]|uniref:hypothetical protein n=1 Tax=Fructobacillus durionis TaxID=283737 RepID=UPI000A91322C|nr:hypothetical protein [Fructobacillus durionis]